MIFDGLLFVATNLKSYCLHNISKIQKCSPRNEKCENNSGAMYAGVPAVSSFLPSPIWDRSTERPKSINTIPLSAPYSTFSNCMSRWTIFFRWHFKTARSSSLNIRRADFLNEREQSETGNFSVCWLMYSVSIIKEYWPTRTEWIWRTWDVPLNF